MAVRPATRLTDGNQTVHRRVLANFDLTPRGITQLLDLNRPVYSQTAKNGHFGHPEFGWEKTDQAAKLAA